MNVLDNLLAMWRIAMLDACLIGPTRTHIERVLGEEYRMQLREQERKEPRTDEHHQKVA